MLREANASADFSAKYGCLGSGCREVMDKPTRGIGLLRQAGFMGQFLLEIHLAFNFLLSNK